MTANAIVQAMMDKDAFSQWLGISILDIEAGKVKIQMEVRQEMVNGFGIAHGGITFSFADSAFAFASNSRGRHAVSIECDISHLKAVYVGDVLTASSEETKFGNSTANYLIRVVNQNDILVALFKGTVFRLEKKWEL